jgi:Peptidase family M28
MDRTYVVDNPPLIIIPAKVELAFGFISLIAIFALAGLSIYRLHPPAAVPAGAPAAEFSSGRAMEHLQTIARTPHPIGSSSHEATRNYILAELTKQGFEPQVQTATAVAPPTSKTFRAGTVQNVTARLKGTSNTKAVMLAAHYDTVPGSPGASDDGAGVTALLETARALKVTAPLKNDVIFLFTDGEEVGLLGARAFVEDHPWAKDVGVVFNLEARGAGGPSTMFETSDGNGWLLQEFARAAPYPFGNSLSYEIYKLLPNDTDVTIFKKAGFSALNFAYVDGLTRYHSALDNIGQLDERSLQQQGANALALVQHFGNLDLGKTRKSNAVYFNFLGTSFIYYPGGAVLPLTLVTLVFFVGVVIIGFIRKLLTVKGILFGFGALFVTGAATALLITGALRLIRMLLPGDEFIPWGDLYDSKVYLISFVCLTVAVSAALYNLFRRKTSIQNLAVGAMLWWVILSVLVSLRFPGASYLFTLPLLGMLVGHAVMFVAREMSTMVKIMLLSLCSVPGVLLLCPIVYLVFVAMTLNASAPIMLLVVLLLGLLISFFALTLKPRNWFIPAGAAALGFTFLVFGFVTAGFDQNRPKADNVFYGLNANTGKAVWGTMDDQADEWTEQFFDGKGEQRPLADLFPMTSFTYFQSDAPAAALPAPEVTLISDNTDNDTRTIRVRITSPRKAEVVSVYFDEGASVASAALNGKSLNLKNAGEKAKWGLHYYGLPATGAELTLALKSSGPVNLRVNDRSYGLPAVAGFEVKARPSYIIPSSSQFSDVTLVSKTFTF